MQQRQKGDSVAFNGSGYHDTDEQGESIEEYSWSFSGGDPASSTRSRVTVTYDETGPYTASLTVTDDELVESLTVELDISVVKVDRVILDGVSPEDEGPIEIISPTSSAYLKAMPYPADATTWPDGEPTWTIDGPSGSSPTVSNGYATGLTVSGDYTVTATCGSSDTGDDIILRVCAGPHPTNFHHTHVFNGSGEPEGSNGLITFWYDWESTCGHKEHLTDCSWREYVDYPGTSELYYWPDVAWNEFSLDPSIAGGSIMDSGTIIDDHVTGVFEKPYGSANFSATQRYEFHCDLCMPSGEYAIMLDVGSIEREVDADVNSPSGYLYHITKSGSEAFTYLPE